jgi:hypothetical protein
MTKTIGGASNFQQHLCSGAATGDKHVRGKRYQFLRIFARFGFIAATPANHDLNIPSVRPTQLLKRFQKCCVACLNAGRVRWYRLKDSDTT